MWFHECFPTDSHEITRLGGDVRLVDLTRLLRTISRPWQYHYEQISARRKDNALVRHGTFHSGDTSERNHLYLDNRSRLHRRNALCAVLLWTSDRYGHSLRNSRADLPSRQSLHSI